MPRGRAASNMAMGLSSLKSGIPARPSVPNIGMTHAPGLQMPVNRMPMPIPTRPLMQLSPTAINRVPSFPSAPATIAPPVLGGPPPTMMPMPSGIANMPVNRTDEGGFGMQNMPTLQPATDITRAQAAGDTDWLAGKAAYLKNNPNG